MFNGTGTTVVRKRLSFPSILAISLAGVIATTIVSVSGIAVYGLRVIDKKSDSLISLVGDAARSLPEFRKALPPFLADAIDDERRPDYLKDLDVSVRLGKKDRRHGSRRAIVEVSNHGDAVVSLLSMRVVGLDEDGDPVDERNTWVATPLQIEDEWRGPLLPHETRRFPVHWRRGSDTVDVTYEITDIRIWRGGDAGTPALTSLTPVKAGPEDRE
jgi:hypothetical protein